RWATTRSGPTPPAHRRLLQRIGGEIMGRPGVGSRTALPGCRRGARLSGDLGLGAVAVVLAAGGLGLGDRRVGGAGGVLVREVVVRLLRGACLGAAVGGRLVLVALAFAHDSSSVVPSRPPAGGLPMATRTRSATAAGPTPGEGLNHPSRRRTNSMSREASSGSRT